MSTSPPGARRKSARSDDGDPGTPGSGAGSISRGYANGTLGNLEVIAEMETESVGKRLGEFNPAIQYTPNHTRICNVRCWKNRPIL